MLFYANKSLKLGCNILDVLALFLVTKLNYSRLPTLIDISITRVGLRYARDMKIV